MLRIAIVGPESSGKTTLAEELSLRTGGVHVAEAARAYLAGLGRPYAEHDLLAIARAQARDEERAAEGSPELVLCDTDLLTVRIWSEERFGRCHPWIAEQSERRPYDLWLLCRPDIPWAPDPLRENPYDRDRLFEAYRSRLEAMAKPYRIIEGAHPARVRQALEAIGQLRPAP